MRPILFVILAIVAILGGLFAGAALGLFAGLGVIIVAIVAGVALLAWGMSRGRGRGSSAGT